MIFHTHVPFTSATASTSHFSVAGYFNIYSPALFSHTFLPNTPPPSLPSASMFRLPLESHDQPGKAAVLRGAGSPQQAASGKVPRLQVQAAAQAHLSGRRQEAANWRVQGHHEVSQTGNEAILQYGVRSFSTHGFFLGRGGFRSCCEQVSCVQKYLLVGISRLVLQYFIVF